VTPSPAAAFVSSLVVPGVPGAPELFVILLVAVLLFGLPLVLVGGAYLYLKRDTSIEELESRIADLEAEQAGGDVESTEIENQDES
jgi:sec-independent protein translocase protein TatA